MDLLLLVAPLLWPAHWIVRGAIDLRTRWLDMRRAAVGLKRDRLGLERDEIARDRELLAYRIELEQYGDGLRAAGLASSCGAESHPRGDSTHR
jgi:hypothetical protein